MYKKIIVAVDLAEKDITQTALAAALEMAQLSKAALRLVYVRHAIPPTPLGLIGDDVLSDQKAHFDKELAALAARLPGGGEQVSVANLSGPIYAAILQEADSWGADLIVVCAHRPSMATYLLGSNAAKIVRHAECSTLVVRSDKKASLLT